MRFHRRIKQLGPRRKDFELQTVNGVEIPIRPSEAGDRSNRTCGERTTPPPTIETHRHTYVMLPQFRSYYVHMASGCNLSFERAPSRGRGDGARRPILARPLMTGAASLALLTLAPAVVRAERSCLSKGMTVRRARMASIRTVPACQTGRGAVAANAGGVHPVTAPVNKATATGGNGGAGGNAGGGGATAATARDNQDFRFGRAEANSSGGSGGVDGTGFFCLVATSAKAVRGRRGLQTALREANSAARSCPRRLPGGWEVSARDRSVSARMLLPGSQTPLAK